jgi:hypothetical protein
MERFRRTPMLSAPVPLEAVPTILEALNSLTKSNQFHERILLTIMGILGFFGVALLIWAGTLGSQGNNLERLTMIIGGVLFEALILLPYNKIQDLRKQNIVIGILAAIIDRFQDKVASETLNKVIQDLLQYSLKR